ncbi:MAG TPA: transcriptional activator NhaR [Phycisphaerae bacterium]|nr:transcriptional activator NhaR [Phycisphaerae bacterium]
MKWLNYNHLYYFWMVAREGSVMRAAEELMVSQPTVSIQLKELERALGHRLFDRHGRQLRLTDAGKVAFNYANEMFQLGRELVNALDDQPAKRPLKLTVGIVDIIPKTMVRHLLEPALKMQPAIRLICREDKADRLLMDLAGRRVDVVLSDAPIGTGVHLRGFNHLLVECGISFLAVPTLAQRHRRNFPKSLNGAPMLLPSDHTMVRQSLNAWFDAQRIHPVVMGEFDDTALMASMAEDGLGIVPFPSIVARDKQRETTLRLVGKTDEARERFYAVSLTEKQNHPAVAAICAAATPQSLLK